MIDFLLYALVMCFIVSMLVAMTAPIWVTLMLAAIETFFSIAVFFRNLYYCFEDWRDRRAERYYERR